MCCFESNPPQKKQLYDHLTPISQNIQDEQDIQGIGRTHKLRSFKDTLTLVDQQRFTFISCVDTGYRQEDLLGVIDGREEWRERVRVLRAVDVT